MELPLCAQLRIVFFISTSSGRTRLLDALYVRPFMAAQRRHDELQWSRAVAKCLVDFEPGTQGCRRWLAASVVQSHVVYPLVPFNIALRNG